MSCFEAGANLGYNMGMESILTLLKNFLKLPKKLVVICFLTLIFFASSWSLFAPKFFRVHDYTHAARISQMTQALTDGHFPVRWTQDFGYGYGMPLFEFYAPLPYYVGSLLYWLGLEMVLTLKILFGLCSLGTLLGAYYLGKKISGDLGGIVVSAALTLAPYRALNLFVRGALSEAWAIMALPWILLGIIEVIDHGMGKTDRSTEKRSWMALIISLCVLFLSHNLTTMMFVPISGIFALLYWLHLVFLSKEKNSRQTQFQLSLKSFYKLASAYILAFALSAFYLVPAFLEKGFTKVEQFVLGGYFDYRLHFLYIRQFFIPNWGYGGSAWGVDDDISFFLGYGQWLALGIVVCMGGVILIRSSYSSMVNSGKRPELFKSMRESKIFWLFSSGFLLGVSLFLSLIKSQFIWDALPLLSFIQFPWRWLSVAIVFVSLLTAVPILFLRGRAVRIFYAWAGVALIIGTNFYYFRPEKYLENATDYYYTDSDLIRKNMSSILEDYVPKQMAENLIPQEGLLNEVSETDQETDSLPNQEHIRKIEYEILLDSTNKKLIRTNFQNEQLLDINLADFPGWMVELDGKSFLHTRGEIGNIQILVPSGEHLVGIRFGYTPVRLLSDGLSFIGILLVFWISTEGDKKRKIVK